MLLPLVAVFIQYSKVPFVLINSSFNRVSLLHLHALGICGDHDDACLPSFFYVV